MSLTTSLASLGRAVAYYPQLSKFFGSVNASIFFSQLHYWQARTNGDMGVFKTAEEWTDETGLSYREQATARKMLVDSGFLVETHKRLQHRVYYRLNLEAVDAAFEAWDKAHFPNDENAIRESTKAQSGECGKSNPGDAPNAVGGTTKAQPVNKVKITAEITSEKNTSAKAPVAGKAKASAFVLPDWIPADTWAAFMETRKAKKARSTDYALGLIVKSLERFKAAGHDPVDVLDNSIKAGWLDVYAPKTTAAITPGRRTPTPENFAARTYVGGKL